MRCPMLTAFKANVLPLACSSIYIVGLQILLGTYMSLCFENYLEDDENVSNGGVIQGNNRTHIHQDL